MKNLGKIILGLLVLTSCAKDELPEPQVQEQNVPSPSVPDLSEDDLGDVEDGLLPENFVDSLGAVKLTIALYTGEQNIKYINWYMDMIYDDLEENYEYGSTEYLTELNKALVVGVNVLGSEERSFDFINKLVEDYNIFTLPSYFERYGYDSTDIPTVKYYSYFGKYSETGKLITPREYNSRHLNM